MRRLLTPRRRTSGTTGIALIVLLAAALAGSAFAASLARAPSQVMLLKSDFPTGTQYTWGKVPTNVIQAMKKLGITSSGAYYAATRYIGNKGGSEIVSGSVYTTASSREARKAYVAFARDYRSGTAKLTVPSYGDEQMTSYKPGSEIAELLVRRNTTVWSLSVQVMGVGVQIQLPAELKKYAAKQKARVGAG